MSQHDGSAGAGRAEEHLDSYRQIADRRGGDAATRQAQGPLGPAGAAGWQLWRGCSFDGRSQPYCTLQISLDGAEAAEDGQVQHVRRKTEAGPAPRGRASGSAPRGLAVGDRPDPRRRRMGLRPRPDFSLTVASKQLGSPLPRPRSRSSRLSSGNHSTTAPLSDHALDKSNNNMRLMMITDGGSSLGSFSLL